MIAGKNPQQPPPEASIYDFSAQMLSGETVSLDAYRGNVLLIVNTASHCGFTPQYAGLEGLYRTYQERGFAILGFPCNQFGAQEPGTSEEIGVFCEANYGVSFPVFAKIDVNGPDANPIFQFLKSRKSGLLGSRILWNFTKFLVDRRGRVTGRFGSTTQPKSLASRIERLLDESVKSVQL